MYHINILKQTNLNQARPYSLIVHSSDHRIKSVQSLVQAGRDRAGSNQTGHLRVFIWPNRSSPSVFRPNVNPPRLQIVVQGGEAFVGPKWWKVMKRQGPKVVEMDFDCWDPHQVSACPFNLLYGNTQKYICTVVIRKNPN